MRIIVSDVAASGGGALTILASFHDYVREFEGRDEWIFLLGADLLEGGANVSSIVLPKVKKSWLRRLAFDIFTGHRLINSLSPDVVLSLQNTLALGVRSPQVVYVHQPLPFQRTRRFSLFRASERRLAAYQYCVGPLIKLSVAKADHVIVQTQWMRDAILTGYGVKSAKVDVVAPDIEDLRGFRRDTEYDTSQFFCPTSDVIYKNNECVVAACRLLVDQGITEFTVGMTVSGRSDSNLEYLGRIPRHGVLERLSRSTLVFASQIETFGLPLAEARALGSIVLAPDLPYAREVLGDYINAHFFDPHSAGELAKLMRQVVSGEITKIPSEQQLSGGPSWRRVVLALRSVSKVDVREP